MKSLKTLNHQNLTLRRTLSLKKSYDLLSGEMLVGKLQYEQGNITASARIAEGSWLFRNTTQVHPHISVWTANREFVAMFEVDRTGSGDLLIQDGRRLRWEQSKRYPLECYFTNIIGERILKFNQEYDSFRVLGESYLYPESRAIPNIGLYVLLGWYTISALETSLNMKRITTRYTPW